MNFTTHNHRHGENWDSIAILVAICLLLMLPMAARAEDAAGAGSDLFTGLLTGFKGALSTFVNSTFGGSFAERLKSAGTSLASNTVGVANALAGALALVTLVWRLVLAMVDKKSIIATTTEVLIYGMIALALINNYDKLVGQVWDISMALLSAVGLDIGTTFAEFLTSFIDPVANLFKKFATETASSDGKWWSLKIITSTLDTVGALIMLVVIVVLLLYSMIHIVGVFIMGPMFFAVGVVFGPIMIATIVSDYTRKWFDQWINFLIGASFLTLTAVVVLKLLTLTISGAVSTAAGEGSSTIALLGVALLMAMASKLFQSVPSITDAIFPGRTGAGSAISSGGGAKSGGGSKDAGSAKQGMVGKAVSTVAAAATGNPVAAVAKLSTSVAVGLGGGAKAAGSGIKNMVTQGVKNQWGK